MAAAATSLAGAPRAFLDQPEVAPNTERHGNGSKKTWDEMKKLYPDQWLEIVDFETDKYGGVASGVVVAHGASS